MVLVKNWPFFHVFFYWQYRPGKCVLRYSRTKIAFLGYKNKNFKKWNNCHFSKGVSPCFWSKIDHFSIGFFFGNTGQENVFYNILERKNVFLRYKNKKFKKWKNCPFFKRGKSMVLVKNWPFFLFFFKGKIGQENVFYVIVERKNAFLGYKNKNFKKGKNCHFSKGVSLWFWSKIDHFSIFFFLAIQARKMCFTIFQNEKSPF